MGNDSSFKDGLFSSGDSFEQRQSALHFVKSLYIHKIRCGNSMLGDQHGLVIKGELGNYIGRFPFESGHKFRAHDVILKYHIMRRKYFGSQLFLGIILMGDLPSSLDFFDIKVACITSRISGKCSVNFPSIEYFYCLDLRFWHECRSARECDTQNRVAICGGKKIVVANKTWGEFLLAMCCASAETNNRES